VKDFNEFLSLVNPKELANEALIQANEKLDKELEISGKYPSTGFQGDCKTVYIVANLLEKYHE